MPLFEFHCPKCDRTFEKLLRKAQTDHPCPACGQPAPRAVSVTARSAGGAAPSCAAPAMSGFG